MYVKHFEKEDKIVLIFRKVGRQKLAGRKSKHSSKDLNENKIKIWQVAIYIRLSQEDAGIRRRKA